MVFSTAAVLENVCTLARRRRELPDDDMKMLKYVGV